MFQKKKLIFILTLMLSTFLVNAGSYDYDRGEVSLFSIFDLNGDDRISMEEMTMAAFNMVQNDSNKDHFLTRNELQSIDDYSHFMMMFDTDQSGNLSMQEIPRAMLHKIMLADGNKDHYVSLEELRAIEEYDYFVVNFDKNNDHELLISEFPRHLRERAKIMDRNGDGLIEVTELQKGAKVMTRKPQSPMNDYQRFIDNYDINDDGMLEAIELPKTLRGRLMLMDKNNNELISVEELQATERYGSHFMATFDFDGDERLSIRELPPVIAERMMKKDQNKDNYLDIEELLGAKDALKQ